MKCSAHSPDAEPDSLFRRINSIASEAGPSLSSPALKYEPSEIIAKMTRDSHATIVERRKFRRWYREALKRCSSEWLSFSFYAKVARSRPCSSEATLSRGHTVCGSRPHRSWWSVSQSSARALISQHIAWQTGLSQATMSRILRQVKLGRVVRLRAASPTTGTQWTAQAGFMRISPSMNTRASPLR